MKIIRKRNIRDAIVALPNLNYPPNYEKPDITKFNELVEFKDRDINLGAWWRYLEVVYSFVGEKQGKFLDLGSGWGTVYQIMKKCGFEAHALDFSNPSNIEKSDFTFWDLDSNDSLPFPDDYFDAIACVEVIEHLTQPIKLLNEISRILKPGGKLVLTTPNILNIRSRYNYLINGLFSHFDWVHNGNHYEPKIDPLHGHVSPMDYYKFSWILNKFGMPIENIRTNHYVRFKGLKKYLFWIIYALIRIIRTARSNPILDRGYSIIIVARKPPQ